VGICHARVGGWRHFSLDISRLKKNAAREPRFEPAPVCVSQPTP